MLACQHSMTMTPSASRTVQEQAALATAGGTEPRSGWAFTDRTHAKQRHVCATGGGVAGERVTAPPMPIFSLCYDTTRFCAVNAK